MPARPLLQIMNRWHRLAWMACIWAGMARKTFFSAVRTATFWIRATHSLGPVGQDTAVLCSSYEGESYVFQLSKSLMVGRFMAQVEQANGYGQGLIPVQLKGRSDWCYIDLNGQKYLNGYQAAGMFQNGKAPVQKDGAWIFVDQTGAQQGDSYEEIQLTENGSWLVTAYILPRKTASGTYIRRPASSRAHWMQTRSI